MDLIQTSRLIADFWPVAAWCGATVIGAVLFYARIQNSIADHDIRITKLEEKDQSIQILNNLVIAIDAKLTVLLPDYKGK